MLAESCQWSSDLTAAVMTLGFLIFLAAMLRSD